MTISTINYRETIFEHPDLSKIIGVPTYDTLYLLYNEIKSNTMAVHSNLGGSQHSYLGFVFRPTSYSLLISTTFVCQVHSVNLSTPIAATRHAQDKLKFQYDENLRVFHETQGVERALIHQLVLAGKARYITAMRSRTTGQFIGTLFMLTQYLIVKYGKISPSQTIDLEQNTKSMHYDLQTPIDIFFNQVEDLLIYMELDRSLYTQIHTKNIAYAIINKISKFHYAIKTWNCMNPMQQNWINFKTHFRTAHRELDETSEL